MTRFEKSLIYVMFILAGISMLLLGRQVEVLGNRVDALEMREATFAPSGADVCTFCVDKKYQKATRGAIPTKPAGFAGAPGIKLARPAKPSCADAATRQRLGTRLAVWRLRPGRAPSRLPQMTNFYAGKTASPACTGSSDGQTSVEGCQWGVMGGHDLSGASHCGPPMPTFGSFVRRQKNETVPPAARAENSQRSAVFTSFAYCACEKCCGRWSQYGLTASGTVPQQGRTVAVDPNIIPLGTALVIDGAGGYIAEDTGSGIAGHTLDLYFERHEDALQYGVRKVTVQWTE